MEKQEAMNKILSMSTEDLEKIISKLSLEEIESLLDKIEEKGDNNE